MIRAIFSTNLTLCDSPIRFYLATSFYTLFNISGSCETLWNYDWYLFCPTCIFNLFFFPILSSFFYLLSCFFYFSYFFSISFYLCLFLPLCITLFYPLFLSCLFVQMSLSTLSHSPWFYNDYSFVLLRCSSEFLFICSCFEYLISITFMLIQFAIEYHSRTVSVIFCLIFLSTTFTLCIFTLRLVDNLLCIVFSFLCYLVYELSPPFSSTFSISVFLFAVLFVSIGVNLNTEVPEI